MTEPLSKVDSAVEGLDSPIEKKPHKRASSSVAGVNSIKDMWTTKTKIQVAKETQGTGWKINTSPTTVEDKDVLKKPLITPPVRAIDLHFGTGIKVTARNRLGLTVKDALDAIHKQNKKRADDELEAPYLAGFEWFPSHREYADTPEGQKEMEEEWQYLQIHLSTNPGTSHSGGKKKNKNKGGE
ncbi:hypothetical protein F4778DRAFT_374684 [Xylariomycetidae sp. FL2044]|nr:hypothetical protein F4778DRAFT_374684 [Xylariomycetidae sp. FL2044]